MSSTRSISRLTLRSEDRCRNSRSRIAEAQRRMPQALELMRTAVKLQDEMPYSEPPAWFYPVRESLGALLLRAGSAAESEAVFRENLQRSPNDPRALLGLSQPCWPKAAKPRRPHRRLIFKPPGSSATCPCGRDL